MKHPQYAWVTPKGSPNCTENCGALGSGWRPANGGRGCLDDDCGMNTKMALCSGLIDMPGLGTQWVPGGTPARHASCGIKCPTNPCYLLPGAPSITYRATAVTAGKLTKAAKGHLLIMESPFPIKCACIHCADQDAVCEDVLWVKAEGSSSCARPNIQPQAGEAIPSAVYSKICRNDESSKFTVNAGWVDAAVSPSVCRGLGWNATNYSVWCPDA